jgi:hypothetical protein
MPRFSNIVGLDDGKGNVYYSQIEKTKNIQPRLTYDDIGLPAYGPCYMRAIMAVAESFIDKNLTADELTTLVNQFTTGANPLVDIKSTFDVNGTTYKSYAVNGTEVEILQATLSVLDSTTDYDVVIARPENANYDIVKSNATASLRNVKPGHWQEGSKDGKFKWDSYYGYENESATVNSTRYVIITRVLKPLEE